jgi:phage gp16-like protein
VAARNKDLAQIHMAKKALGLSDADYRLLLSERFGVMTSAALGPVQRQELLAELEARGWRRGWGRQAAQRVEARGKDTRQLAKVRALLAEGGKTIEYGDALAKRLAGVDRLEWCKPPQLGKVIAALELDARRRAAKAVELPPMLARLTRERPGLERRVRGMYAGSLRRNGSPERACAWVLDVLRNEASEVAAAGAEPERVRFVSARQYARDKSSAERKTASRDRAFLDALTLIALIDRIRLEVVS